MWGKSNRENELKLWGEIFVLHGVDQDENTDMNKDGRAPQG